MRQESDILSRVRRAAASRILMLDAVPAWVCTQCGEPHFEEKEVDAIQDLVASVEERAEAFALTA